MIWEVLLPSQITTIIATTGAAATTASAFAIPSTNPGSSLYCISSSKTKQPLWRACRPGNGASTRWEWIPPGQSGEGHGRPVPAWHNRPYRPDIGEIKRLVSGFNEDSVNVGITMGTMISTPVFLHGKETAVIVGMMTTMMRS